MASRWSSVSPSVVHTSVRFLFPDDNLSKHNGFSPNLELCIEIVEIWFGIANGQISSIFLKLLMGKFCQIFTGVICPRHIHIFISG